jgi:hypothetical protein
MRDAIRGVAAGLMLCCVALPGLVLACDEKPPEEKPLELPAVKTLNDWDGKDPYPYEVASPATVAMKVDGKELVVFGTDPDKDVVVFIYRVANEEELLKLTGENPRGGITLVGLSSASIGLIQRPVPNPTPTGEGDDLTRMSKGIALVQRALAQLGKAP